MDDPALPRMWLCPLDRARLWRPPLLLASPAWDVTSDTLVSTSVVNFLDVNEQKKKTIIRGLSLYLQDNWGQTMSTLASVWRGLSDENREVYRVKARRHNAARLSWQRIRLSSAASHDHMPWRRQRNISVGVKIRKIAKSCCILKAEFCEIKPQRYCTIRRI